MGVDPNTGRSISRHAQLMTNQPPIKASIFTPHTSNSPTADKLSPASLPLHIAPLATTSCIRCIPSSSRSQPYKASSRCPPSDVVLVLVLLLLVGAAVAAAAAEPWESSEHGDAGCCCCDRRLLRETNPQRTGHENLPILETDTRLMMAVTRS